MPNAHARLTLLPLAVALACLAWPPAARTQTAPPKGAPASVEGRVTDGEDGLAGVLMMVISLSEVGRRPTRPVARAKTDHEGRYRLTGIPPGRYQVMPAAPAFVPTDNTENGSGRMLLLGPGDTVGDVDFRLTRGAVITGRVTDADGLPVIGEQVQVIPVEPPQPQRRTSRLVSRTHMTDDRGIYRIFGLPAGSYRVSAGQDTETGAVRMNGARRFYRRTFHPDAAQESEGRIVEVGAGSEATGVDITLGRAARTYTASGRFLDPDGRPAPGVPVSFGIMARESRGDFFGGGVPTNARGEFLLEGLVPGTYTLFATPSEGGSETYSETVQFTISDSDVSGLEVKLRRGASVSGVVAVEGTSDRATLARILRQFRLSAHSEAPRTGGGSAPPNFSNVEVAPDGSFRLAGLRPGRLRLGLGWPQKPGVMLERIEVGGVEQHEGVEVAEGAQITGVRVVISFGTSVVRGQVNVTNGTLTPDARLHVSLRRVVPGEGPRQSNWGRGAQTDARGRFLLEGLPAGEYEIMAQLFIPQARRGATTARQQLFVPEGGEVTVTLTLDLNQ